ncbi:MAG: NADPH:quinone oxidoreductase family protein [Anaerolineae bacterium]|nr:NADPH:quinone oxidoreductase family protein [Anaerolineae bacterium]
MKAILCREWGDPSLLTLTEVDRPVLPTQAGFARIKIHACGVNFADTLMIAGQYQVKPPLPFTPGMEIAGEVIEVSDDATPLKVGTRIMAVCEYGGMAEEVVISAQSAIPIPDGMSYDMAAAFPIAYGTSHLALEHRAHLQAGETLLVLGAGGGVGSTAVQIGKLMGATVIAAASSSEKLDLAHRFGADHRIDYTKENLRDRVREITHGQGANVIYDPVGGDLFDQALRSIAWEGRLLVIGFAAGKIPQLPVNLTLVKNCSVLGVYWGAYLAKDPKVLIGSLRQLLKWSAEGRLQTSVARTFDLAHAPEALYSLIQRQAVGKVVITIP